MGAPELMECQPGWARGIARACARQLASADRCSFCSWARQASTASVQKLYRMYRNCGD